MPQFWGKGGVMRRFDKWYNNLLQLHREVQNNDPFSSQHEEEMERIFGEGLELSPEEAENIFFRLRNAEAEAAGLRVRLQEIEAKGSEGFWPKMVRILRVA